jgi:XisH protein
MARDTFHNAVRRALEKERWQITDDPLKLEYKGARLEIDLGAERLLAAERGEEHIAVEIKSFSGKSALHEFHAALGQYINYRRALKA